jgi:phosphopantothenoylcysteine decarboxylase/phosphopantothenate--cysteine ligase
VTLVCGPVHVPDPLGVKPIRVTTARQMLEAVEHGLPADAAIFAAAVADWGVAKAETQKIKKTKAGAPSFALKENPDILATIAKLKSGRPRLVVGFAAETEKVIEHAQSKLKSKGCDWIVANDVSPRTGVMGGDRNTVHLVTARGVESRPSQSKDEVARALIDRVATALNGPSR